MYLINVKGMVCRAAAVNACKYDWIAVVDADDISMPDRFDSTNLVVQYPKAAVVGGGLVEFEIEDGAMIFGPRSIIQ